MAMRLTPDEAGLLERSTVLARELVARNAARWERERRIGHEALHAAVALGLLRLQVPKTFGGLDHSFLCKARIAEVLAAADSGFAMSLLNTQNVAANLARNARARHSPDRVSPEGEAKRSPGTRRAPSCMRATARHRIAGCLCCL
jgi:alkylation response protein AidB-like acyl-CoA dehydrogenase